MPAFYNSVRRTSARHKTNMETASMPIDAVQVRFPQFPRAESFRGSLMHNLGCFINM